MSTNNSNSSAGIGFPALLTVAFVVLKLCKIIDWSWWWVLAPVWLPTVLIIVWVFMCAIFREIRINKLEK